MLHATANGVIKALSSVRVRAARRDLRTCIVMRWAC